MTPSAEIWTLLIIALTVCVSAAGFRNPNLVGLLIFSPQAILARGEGYRLITSAFVHGDWRHLIFNLFSFYCFGGQVEAVCGPVVFLVIYFSSILGGGLLALLLHRHHEYPALGASGGVCGIIFASIFLGSGYISGLLFPLPVPAWLYAIIFLVGSYYGIRTKRDNIGHDAHLGGAIIGLFTTAAFYPWIVETRPLLFATVSGLALVLLFALIKHPSGVFPVSFPSPLPGWPGTRKVTPLAPEAEMRRVNAILDKISRQGLNSLTASEQKTLREASRRQRQPPPGA